MWQWFVVNMDVALVERLVGLGKSMNLESQALVKFVLEEQDKRNVRLNLIGKSGDVRWILRRRAMSN